MNIIICGAGKVGFSISKQLSAQGHSVTVIDQSSDDIKRINDTQDAKGIVGRASLPSVLENAGAEKADMIIAVTRNDETNMIVCQLASSLFNISKKIARIRTKDFLEGKWGKLFNKSNIPIDVIISPEIEVARSLYRRLEAPGALDNVPFGNNKVKMLEISIEKNCPLKNVPLKKLTEKFPDFKANILGALRKDKFYPLYNVNLLLFQKLELYLIPLFAPGDKIWSTIPNKSFDYHSGTSMAAPNASGVAALLRSYFPKLSASEVKKILMDSGLPLFDRVKVPGSEKLLAPKKVSKSGKLINLYNALIYASKKKYYDK